MKQSRIAVFPMIVCFVVVAAAQLSLVVIPALAATRLNGLPTEKAPASGEHGGAGIMKDYGCIKPSSSVVSEVCFDYQISWKLWILMGEPVGDYRLKWALKSLKLVGGGAYASSGDVWANNLGLPTVPPQLQKGVNSMELYLDGMANVRIGGGYTPLNDKFYGSAHAFNTGTATRTGKSSFNTPESPKWSETFLEMSSRPGFMSAERAKVLFAGSRLPDMPLELFDFKIGPKSTVTGLDVLENQVASLCANQKNSRFEFCPAIKEKLKKDTKKGKAKNDNKGKEGQENDPIDDAFADLDKAKGKTGSKSGSSIDDAFSGLNKRKTSKAGQGIDAGFGDVAAHRAEVERQRRAEEVLAAQSKEDRRFCDAATAEKEQCLVSRCGQQPKKEIDKCRGSRLDAPYAKKVMLAQLHFDDTRNDAAGDLPVTLLLPIPQNTDQNKSIKIARDFIELQLKPSRSCPTPNPLYNEWETCMADNAGQCASQSKAYSSVDQCVSQREKSRLK
jgi:hypothetical protein